MLRNSCLEKTGLFDEAIRSLEDRDLWMRISAAFSIACIPSINCKRRFHEGNISSQRELTLQGRIRVLEKNWNLFPALVSDRIWRQQLADYRCALGFLLLQKGRKRDAFQAGFQNFSNNLKRRNWFWSLPEPFVMVKSFGLLCAALLGWNVSRFLWKPIKRIRVTL